MGSPALGKLCRAVVRIFFRDITIEGTGNLPDPKLPVIFTPNHPNSLVDPLLLQFLNPQYDLHFVAKEPLFRVPIYGSLLRRAGGIPVVRKMDVQGEVDYSAFFSKCVSVLAKGGSIVIFPEGRSWPQSYMAPIKTGPARLFFMARDQGINVSVVPVGLNYENGTTFRSSVLMSIAPQISAERLESIALENRPDAVRDLTSEINESIGAHIVQTETYRERELMLVLQRLLEEEPEEEFAREKFEQLKQFEKRLVDFKHSRPEEIMELRRLLNRYDRLTRMTRVQPVTDHNNIVFMLLLPLIFLGAVVNYIPYKLCGILTKRKDYSMSATFKIGYGFLFFPLFYLLEGLVVYELWGSAALVGFVLLLAPLDWLTITFLERYEYFVGWLTTFGSRKRISSVLGRLRSRIQNSVRTLTAS